MPFPASQVWGFDTFTFTVPLGYGLMVKTSHVHTPLSIFWYFIDQIYQLKKNNQQISPHVGGHGAVVIAIICV